jgi:hypothetical protein
MPKPAKGKPAPRPMPSQAKNMRPLPPQAAAKASAMRGFGKKK